MEVSLFHKELVDCNQDKERKMAIAQENLEKQWENIQPQLLDEYGEGTYTSWIKPLTFIDMENGCFRLAAPTSFMRDWVKDNYATRMQALLQGKNDNSFRLDIIVAPEQSSQETSSSTSALDASDIGSNLDPRFTFDNFVVGKPNELAHAAALKVAESDTVAFNPLFLYGGVGLGKTHLMHAIAWQIKKCHPKRRVIYLSAEKFMYQFVRALRFKDTVSFKEQFRSVDVLMIDDVQFIGGKESTQEEFFHTFNALVDQNRQIIISADKSPSDLEGMEERLKSRLGWGLVADIHPTTYELRLGILQAKSEQIGVTVPQKVLEFLAYKISSNVRELEGALTRVVAHSTLVGREITLDTTHEVLRDLLRANDRRVTIDEIQKKVAEYYSIRISDMHSPRRARTVARPRQVAMYLTKVLTTRSLPEIGRKFGGRDHTTVLHAVKKIEELMGEDKTICEDIELLRRTLEA
jgi:chromosomal replication initiator protein